MYVLKLKFIINIKILRKLRLIELNVNIIKSQKLKNYGEIKLKREAKLSRIERSEQIKKFLKE